MKLPRMVKIGLHTYPVSYQKGEVREEGFENGLQGCFICVGGAANRRIRVSTGCSEDVPATLTHEILHGVVQEWDLAGFLVDGSQEHVVESLTKGILCVLRENKGLAEYLIEGDG